MEQLPVIWTAAQCGFHDWQEIWGDPWLSGTVMVLAYAITGLLLMRTARQLVGRERVLWTICSLVLIFQAFNTPLDMHAFVWTFGKCLAKAQGWYEARAQVQIIVFLSLVSLAAVLVLTCIFVFRRNILGNLVLLSGVTLALGMTAVKAIDLPGVGPVHQQTLGPFFVADWIELGGVALAFLALMLRRRRLARQEG